MVRVYAIASAKGGVGKTTTTANLGSTLAGAGADVVVIDGDIGMANLGAALGVRPHGATLHDVLGGSVEPVAAAYEGPAGLTVVPGDTSLEAFSAADPQRLQSVVDAFDDADYVLIDVGAGVSHETSVPLSVADAVILVSTAERDALVDTEKTRQLTERLGGVVAGAILTRTDEAAPIQEIISGTLTAEVLATIPEDEAVRESIAVGEPLPSYAPHSDAAAAYRRLATELTGTDIPAPDPAPVDSESETGTTSNTGSETDTGSESDTGTAADDTEAAPEPDASVGSDHSESSAESGVTIDPETDPTGDVAAETATESDDEHNVVNPFAATPKDDAPVDAPDGAESKWAEAATGTGGSTDDDIEIDPGVDRETETADTDGVEIDQGVDSEPDTPDDGIEIHPETDDESVPSDAIPFGSDDADDEPAGTTVLGEAIEEEVDTEESVDDSPPADDADAPADEADDEGPLIPDAEETAAANAEAAADADAAESKTVDESDDGDEDDEKRGFFSRLFR